MATNANQTQNTQLNVNANLFLVMSNLLLKILYHKHGTAHFQLCLLLNFLGCNGCITRK